MKIIKNPLFWSGTKIQVSSGEYWRYRVGDIRVICNIEDGQMMVLVIEIGNRHEVYRQDKT